MERSSIFKRKIEEAMAEYKLEFKNLKGVIEQEKNYKTF